MLGAVLKGAGVLVIPLELPRLARLTAWAISSFCRLNDSLSTVPPEIAEPGVPIFSFS